MSLVILQLKHILIKDRFGSIISAGLASVLIYFASGHQQQPDAGAICSKPNHYVNFLVPTCLVQCVACATACVSAVIQQTGAYSLCKAMQAPAAGLISCKTNSIALALVVFPASLFACALITYMAGGVRPTTRLVECARNREDGLGCLGVEQKA